MQISLNDLYLQFSEGKMSRSSLEGSIYKFLLSNQDKTCLSRWRSYEYEDYISWFYPRLKKAIDSYSEIGSSFKAFINKFILVSSKEYRIMTTTQNITEYSAWNARVSELYVHEDAAGYSGEKGVQTLTKLIKSTKKRKNTKRILALILKCYYYVSEDFLRKAAPKIGIDADELILMIDKVRKARQKKDDAIYLMKERVYCQYYRCIVYENKLNLIQENTHAHDKLKIRLEKARQRLSNMRKHVAQIRKDATNSQIAQAIGVKKGTVDSCLYKLRLKMEMLSDKSDLN